MSHEELEQGKSWVEDTIRRLARERGVEVTEPFQWHHDFNREVYWLGAVMNGVTKRWSFSFENLEDCVGDRNVQRDLQKTLAFFVIPGNEESTLSIANADLQEKDKKASGPQPAHKSGLAMPDIGRAPTRLLRVFLCHSSADKPAVRNLYQRLLADGVDPWLDEEKILPGQDWELEIKKAVRESDVIIVCLTRSSVTREGFVQKEIKEALDVGDQKPEGTIFVIPVKLEECIVPDRLRRWQWVNLFEANGYEKLMRALRARATALAIKFLNPQPKNANLQEEPEVGSLSSELEDILCSAAKEDGRLLLFTTDSGEWFIDIGSRRLPHKQSPYASAKIREVIKELSRRGLLEPNDPISPDGSGVYSVTAKGFEICGAKD
jgi:hypothetical protein